MRSITCLRIALAMLVLCSGTVASAQVSGVLGGDFSVPPAPIPVGAGARAAGMGDAFVAVADDATAASWNPAGLIQLEKPELSIVGDFRQIEESLSAFQHPEFDTAARYDRLSLNFLSAVYPLPWLILGRNVTVSLSFQEKYDFNREFDVQLTTFAPTTPIPGISITQFGRMRFEQEGSLNTITPAVAFEITPTLSVGAALNLWRSTPFAENGWEQTTRINSPTLIGRSFILGRGTSREKYEDFSGENVTLGLLWNVAPRWSLGLRYDSAFTGDVRYTSTDRFVNLSLSATRLSPVGNFDRRHEQRSMRLPESFAAGVSYKPNDRLLLAFDITRTGWNDTFLRDNLGRKYSLIDGTDLRSSQTRTRVDPTYSVRFGAEYLFIPKDPGTELNYLPSIRAGLFYEEEPATSRPAYGAPRRGDGSPDAFYGFALGFGLLARQRFNFDIAYQLRIGNGVNRDLNPGVSGFDTDEIRHRFLFSTVIYF